jgi:uncharacterized membrane protein
LQAGSPALHAANLFCPISLFAPTAAKNWKGERVDKVSWEILIAHNHWITLTIHGKKLRVCARCSGVTLGFFTMLMTTIFLEFPYFQQLPAYFQVGFCIALVLPVIFDWVTQSWRLRESNNRLRFFTGFLEGVAVIFLYISALSLIQKFLIVILIGGTVLSIGRIGSKLINPLRIDYSKAKPARKP